MPTDRGLIDQQLQALGDSARWWDQRELRDLPAVLDPDEEILAIARGRVARVRWLRRSWLIVVTQRRLVCLRSSGRSSWRQFEVSTGEITRVSLRIGPLNGRVLVMTGGGTYRLLVPRADAYKLQTALAGLATSVDRASPRFAPTRVVHRMLDHVLALPAVALGPDPSSPRALKAHDPRALEAAGTSALAERLQAVEHEVHELRQQVGFLEQLLRQRHVASTAGDEFPSI
jgi:hypothetical protein